MPSLPPPLQLPTVTGKNLVSCAWQLLKIIIVGGIGDCCPVLLKVHDLWGDSPQKFGPMVKVNTDHMGEEWFLSLVHYKLLILSLLQHNENNKFCPCIVAFQISLKSFQIFSHDHMPYTHVHTHTHPCTLPVWPFQGLLCKTMVSPNSQEGKQKMINSSDLPPLPQSILSTAFLNSK